MDGGIDRGIDADTDRRAGEDVVQRQLEAYNDRDLDRFLGCYSVDATVRHGDGRVLMQGHDALAERYGALFARNPSLRAEVTARLRAGDWTVDEEHVTIDGVPRHVLVGYRVQDGLIHDVVMMRSDA